MKRREKGKRGKEGRRGGEGRNLIQIIKRLIFENHNWEVVKEGVERCVMNNRNAPCFLKNGNNNNEKNNEKNSNKSGR